MSFVLFLIAIAILVLIVLAFIGALHLMVCKMTYTIGDKVRVEAPGNVFHGREGVVYSVDGKGRCNITDEHGVPVNHPNAGLGLFAPSVLRRRCE